MIWNIQEFIDLIKQNLMLRDLPPAATDEELINRIKLSSLKEFSILYPRIEEFRMGFHDLVDPNDRMVAKSAGIRYYIPKYFLMQYRPTTCLSVDPVNYYEGSGMIYPYDLGYDPCDLMVGVAGVKALAGMAGNITNGITFAYDNTKNVIRVYNGWTESAYLVRMGVQHDINLTTIPDTAMLSFLDLATNDVGEFIYSILMRKDNLETGGGTIDLKLDRLAECAGKHREIVEKLTEEANLDQDEMEWI